MRLSNEAGRSRVSREMDPLIGQTLEGRYRIVSRLGEGAMGTVYRAERTDAIGSVAVKVLQEDCSADPDLRERFEREARALFGLEHPHILGVQDYGVVDGKQPFLVMELLEGESLEALVEAGPLDPAVGLGLAREFLAGLAFAHGQGVLHRDLKAENIFVIEGKDGRKHAKLLDFGLVKFVDDERWGEAKKLTVAGSVMGSPAYMSPEQGTGGAVDARSDVYSAAIVIYELLTGTWPFMGESRMEMLKAHLLEPVPALAVGRPDLVVRPELDALLARAMAKDPGDRFPDAVAMLTAFEAIPDPVVTLQGARPVQAPAAPPAATLPARPPRSASPPAGALPSGPTTSSFGAQSPLAQQVEPRGSNRLLLLGVATAILAGGCALSAAALVLWRMMS